MSKIAEPNVSAKCDIQLVIDGDGGRGRLGLSVEIPSGPLSQLGARMHKAVSDQVQATLGKLDATAPLEATIEGLTKRSQELAALLEATDKRLEESEAKTKAAQLSAKQIETELAQELAKLRDQLDASETREAELAAQVRHQDLTSPPPELSEPVVDTPKLELALPTQMAEPAPSDTKKSKKGR